MKAITTIYNGYRFRSRLEARWAVFFDKMNVKYQYELEGFVLQNKMTYLPDFYIEEMNLFVEIKPSIDLMTNDDIDKIISFSIQEKQNLLLITGEPTKEKMFLISHYLSPSIEEAIIECEEESCADYHEYWKKMIAEDNLVKFDTDLLTLKLVIVPIGRIRENITDFDINVALTKAKQARFEFGEKG